LPDVLKPEKPVSRFSQRFILKHLRLRDELTPQTTSDAARLRTGYTAWNYSQAFLLTTRLSWTGFHVPRKAVVVTLEPDNVEA